MWSQTFGILLNKLVFSAYRVPGTGLDYTSIGKKSSDFYTSMELTSYTL